ncbi:MAG: ABC transporter permease, partial [Solobacterium sp.]|nr:ABC transporter permease [Solobacterium sp.]
MNFFQRAIRYVRRKPSKSLLLTITFFLIGNLVILGLGVSQAAENAKVLTRKKMRAVVSYEVDYDKFWAYVDGLTDSDEAENAWNNSPKIDRDTAVALTDDPRVVAFNYMTTNVAYGKDVESVPLGNEEERGNNDSSYVEPNLMIYANMFPDMLELHEGTYTVTDGRWYNQNEIDDAAPVVLITEELADQNSLRVGDTLTITTTDPND